MRTLLAISALLALTACFHGDPRTTELENKTPNKITVSFTDGGSHMKQNVEVESGQTGDLWPNYQFDELQDFKITERKREFSLSSVSRSKLGAACSGFCTLSYLGDGHLAIRHWQGFDHQ